MQKVYFSYVGIYINLTIVTDQKQRTPSTETKDEAIRLLFGSVTDLQRQALYSYIDKKYIKLHSVVLYANSPEFAYLCGTLGLTPGQKNVTINEYGTLLFAKANYIRTEKIDQ